MNNSAIEEIFSELDSLGLPDNFKGVWRSRKSFDKSPNLFIEHTALKANATLVEIKQLCREAIENHFLGVCVNPAWVKLARDEIKDSGVLLVSVVGFPLGASFTKTKMMEAKLAVNDGADEIDMVIPVGKLKDHAVVEVYEDITAVVKSASPRPVKVIIETAYLKHEEKVLSCLLAKRAGAAFVKTSTGFGPAGANVNDVILMRDVVGNDMGIKAAGGIKTFDFAKELVDAGADRIGCSSSLEIVKRTSSE